MRKIKLRDLSDEFSWQAMVEGINWDALADKGIRAELNGIFADRGLIVFKSDLPPLKGSSLRYGFAKKEDNDGKE